MKTLTLPLPLITFYILHVFSHANMFVLCINVHTFCVFIIHLLWVFFCIKFNVL